MPEPPNRNWGAQVNLCSAVSYFSTRKGSIIGAGRLSFRVRDGTGRFPAAMDRRNSILLCGDPHRAQLWVCFGGGVIGVIIRGVWLRARCVFFFLQRLRGVVSFRPVSASSLHLLLGFQVWSINPVGCGGPYPS